MSFQIRRRTRPCWLSLLLRCRMAALWPWRARASPIRQRWTSPGSEWERDTTRWWVLRQTSPSMWPSSQRITITVKPWMSTELDTQNRPTLMSRVRFVYFLIACCYFSPDVWLAVHKQLNPFSLSVAPEILPSSRCIKILSQFRCSCDSQGNPLPSLVWELAGDPVNHSADIPIREVTLGGFGKRSVITLYHLDKDVPSLLCLTINSLGSDSLAFNVSASETQLGREICRMLSSYLF